MGRQNHEPSLIDHLYTNKPRWISQVINRNMTGRDHNAIGARCNIEKEVFVGKTFSVRKIDKVCPITFARIFASTNPAEIMTKTDLDEAVQAWEDRVTWTLNQVAPLQKITIKENYCPWLDKRKNPELQEEIAETKRIEKKNYKFQPREVLNIAHILCVYEVLLISMQVAKNKKGLKTINFVVTFWTGFHSRFWT